MTLYKCHKVKKDIEISWLLLSKNPDLFRIEDFWVGTLRRHNFDRSERCPKLFALLETLADSKTYRGFAPASPNLFCLWQKRVLIRITLSHQNKNTAIGGVFVLEKVYELYALLFFYLCV